MKFKKNFKFGIFFILALVVTLLSIKGINRSEFNSSIQIKELAPALIGVSNPPLVIKNNSSHHCSTCTYVVPPKKYEIDGLKLGFKPGDVICLDASTTYGSLKFVNLKGRPDRPISIVNCGGQVHIKAKPGASVSIGVVNSQYFKISGTKSDDEKYGIVLSGAKVAGLSLGYLSSNFEIENIEVYDVGFAGIMAKTDPSCDSATIRGNFYMRDLSFHHNYIHDTGGEGFYIGNSFYASGFKTKCGQRLPHDIIGVRVYENILKNTGWESIQVGSATQGAEIYGNTIENYGVADRPTQNNGIQIGGGTGGLCYNNLIKKGKGNGIIVFGTADNLVFNNVIIEAGKSGIFCDERNPSGKGYKFINNTIINPKRDGIRIFADLVDQNVIVNNIIVNPGSFEEYGGLLSNRSSSDAYVYKLSNDVKIDMSNNYFTRDIESLKFKDADNYDFSLTSESPAIDAGCDVKRFNILIDFVNSKRPNGKVCDIGAFEY